MLQLVEIVASNKESCHVSWCTRETQSGDKHSHDLSYAGSYTLLIPYWIPVVYVCLCLCKFTLIYLQFWILSSGPILMCPKPKDGTFQISSACNALIFGAQNGIIKLCLPKWMSSMMVLSCVVIANVWNKITTSVFSKLSLLSQWNQQTTQDPHVYKWQVPFE